MGARQSTITVPPEERSPLNAEEIKWRERYNMLESHGYRLRPRYRPDWKPSWLETKRRPEKCEDYISNPSSRTIDATRTSDGRRVFLKRVLTGCVELQIAKFLSEKERLEDPRNHAVPLLDVVVDENDKKFSYMVFPLLRPYYRPDFYSVDEVVDFIHQLLEGIVYLHKLDIAHRDCADLNIMMDTDKMFPRGFHPYSLAADNSGYYLARPKRRRDVSYPRYYFIDFGISTWFFPEETDRRVYGSQGQDDEVPELSDTVPYNPFFVDVFILGNLFKKAFLERYTNLTFLEPLIEPMTRQDWMERVTASKALSIFKDIISWQSWYTLRWRLKERDTGRAAQLVQDVGTALRESTHLAKITIEESFSDVVTSIKDRGKDRNS